MMLKIVLAILLVAVGSAGCASDCESSGRKEFHKQHPDYRIIEISPDGNDKSVTYVVHFKKPNDEKTYFASISTEDNKTGKCEVKIDEY